MAATKIPKSAHFTLSLDAGISPTSGNAIRKSISVSNLVPGADIDKIDVVSTAVGTMLEKPVLI